MTYREDADVAWLDLTHLSSSRASIETLMRILSEYILRKRITPIEGMVMWSVMPPLTIASGRMGHPTLFPTSWITVMIYSTDLMESLLRASLKASIVFLNGSFFC